MFRKIKYKLHKIFHWEYWPQALVYAPIFPVYLYYAAKTGTLYFTITSNPDMENGGYLMESKFKIYQKLPFAYIPKTILISNETTFEQAKEQMQLENICFPCICKPDVGGKGIGVEVIMDSAALKNYHQKLNLPYLIQEKVNFKKEIGVFYCRYPNEENGFLTGIVGKIDMQITGDGKKSVAALITENPRFYYQKDYLFEKFSTELNRILPPGELLVLSSIGNHARGSEFEDLTNLITPELTNIIDKISKKYNTFYFGRYDIMFDDWDKLKQGKAYCIIELNGCGSEPTHIYDPKTSIFKAWKIILAHWKIVYRIAKQQHQRNFAYTSIKEGKKLQKSYALHKKMIKTRQ